MNLWRAWGRGTAADWCHQYEQKTHWDTEICFKKETVGQGGNTVVGPGGVKSMGRARGQEGCRLTESEEGGVKVSEEWAIKVGKRC